MAGEMMLRDAEPERPMNLFIHTKTVFSPCRAYRYYLSRTWEPERPSLCFLMLNPSTADEVANDPTVERCMRRAEKLGYGGLIVINIFALRATDPKVMLAHPEPIGPDNNWWIIVAANECDAIVCAWGQHGKHMGRAESVKEITLARHRGKFRHLGLTKDGEPRHPLYVGYDVPLTNWADESDRGAGGFGSSGK